METQNNRLLNSIKEQTQKFRTALLETTANWANEEIVRLKERHDFYKKNSGKPELFSSREAYYREQKWYWNFSTKNLDPEYFKQQTLKQAELQFDESLAKLCAKIANRGLNLDKIVVTALRTDNFEYVVSDGEKRIRVFTVLAWGEIYRPHYRYIIK